MGSIMHHYLKAQVSLGAIRHNLRAIRRRIGDNCRVCAMVKADAYGHGLAGLMETIASESDILGVATIGEALEIRRMGFGGELLVTMDSGPQAVMSQRAAASEAIRHDLTLSVTALESAAAM